MPLARRPHAEALSLGQPSARQSAAKPDPMRDGILEHKQPLEEERGGEAGWGGKGGGGSGAIDWS
eukprot:CAMPEP_0181199288 /NCGR_PEP_ID=MMETSP1096-20121128/17091_1 /TAXON_ID=156174 ORGANISM="Chrysochromulina ericina, Strain CCMP281" /NCGR_SAMPLE_ID=MMETSP1096 /ASSEMBLY_ACC=CAM_ASM_000453 /LENGTH=64 /DNA_ID=CAMNT_0023289449 /DNA_START=558 /DNA_END=749 /DNA_ORIENTATION=+